MPRRYPSLSRRDVIAILDRLGFKLNRTKGSHENYVLSLGGKNRVVTVVTNKDFFHSEHVRTFVKQSGFSREEFYGAIRRTAKKIDS